MDRHTIKWIFHVTKKLSRKKQNKTRVVLESLCFCVCLIVCRKENLLWLLCPWRTLLYSIVAEQVVTFSTVKAQHKTKPNSTVCMHINWKGKMAPKHRSSVQRSNTFEFFFFPLNSYPWVQGWQHCDVRRLHERCSKQQFVEVDEKGVENEKLSILLKELKRKKAFSSGFTWTTQRDSSLFFFR